MSEFIPALSYTLNWEDPKRDYAVVPDVGGFAIAGVNSNSWPEAYREITETSQSQRYAKISYFYYENFWVPLKIKGLDSQDLANRVFDEGVNASSLISSKLLQRAISSLGKNLEVDGVIGPATLEAANSLDQEKLLVAFKEIRLHYYEDIVANHPQFSNYLGEWRKRALA